MTKKAEGTAAEQRASIVESLLSGLRLDVAAKAAGVSASTATGWLTEGQAAREREEEGDDLDEAERVLADFADQVDAAEAEFECQLVREVRDSGPTWSKAAWLLERRYPERWSARVQETVAKERADLLAVVKGTLDEQTAHRIIEAASRSWGGRGITARAGALVPPGTMNFPSEEAALSFIDEVRANLLARRGDR